MKTLRIILIVLSLGLLILRCVNPPMLPGISPALLAAIAIALILWEDGVRISNYRRIGGHGTEYVSRLVEVGKEDRTFRHEAMFGENYHLMTEIELAGRPERFFVMGHFSKAGFAAGDTVRVKYWDRLPDHVVMVGKEHEKNYTRHVVLRDVLLVVLISLMAVLGI